MECAVRVKAVAETNNVLVEEMGSFVQPNAIRSYPVVRT